MITLLFFKTLPAVKICQAVQSAKHKKKTERNLMTCTDHVVLHDVRNHLQHE